MSGRDTYQKPVKLTCATSSLRTHMQLIKLEDFEDIVTTDETFFLYLQNFDTSVADLVRGVIRLRSKLVLIPLLQQAVKTSVEPLLGSVPTYTSSDPLLYRNLSIANPPPTSTLLGFSSFSPLPIGSLSFPAQEGQLDRFISLHRFPPLVQLVSSNYQSLMKGDTPAIVVLGAVHKGEEGIKEREMLETVARAWKRGARPITRPVRFAWVEGERWSAWLKQAYGIKRRELPAVVVIETTVRRRPCLMSLSLLKVSLAIRVLRHNHRGR